MLPEEATHYAIPTSDVVGPFLEIFEQPAISGVILLQTVVSSVKESKKGTVYQRLKALTNERRRGNIFFSNELCKQTFVDPASNAGWTWGKRCVLLFHQLCGCVVHVGGSLSMWVCRYPCGCVTNCLMVLSLQTDMGGIMLVRPPY